jgi:hypothetical protein
LSKPKLNHLATPFFPAPAGTAPLGVNPLNSSFMNPLLALPLMMAAMAQQQAAAAGGVQIPGSNKFATQKNQNRNTTGNNEVFKTK